MKRYMHAILILFVLIAFTPATTFSQAKKDAPKNVKKGASCSICHKDIQAALPKNHKKVTGDNISACISCHKPDLTGKAEPKFYASNLHRVHIKEGALKECMMCHTFTANKFGISGYKGFLGKLSKEDLEKIKDIFVSWSGSKNTDAIHGKANILCSGCHEKNLPSTGDTVENDRCLICHGPLDALKKRSEPKDFPDRNPHNSHLGDIACTVCHKAHSISTVYCLGCHGNFKMKIPGGQ
ncbi:MAG: cytochrome c3 family protein [Syntrophorhabdaceae bacterium]|nr:cytochrome c3 family protein [Syntrophorhabdaceae bacterium]